MDEVKKWRPNGDAKKEKKTDRKFLNSWSVNKAKEEYQMDLFFFQDLLRNK